MKFNILICSILVIFLNLQISSAEENEYGTLKAWFNDKNATLETIENINLKIGETSEVKIEVTSKVNGHVTIVLIEPGFTKAFDILNGPSKLDEKISNLGIESGWTKTYSWILAPNGAWKNGNAPINIYVKFYNIQTKKDKTIQFTIANPFILDEQYPGSTPSRTTGTVQPSPTGTSSESKPSPFLHAAGAIAVVIGVWMLMRRRAY